MDKKIFTIGSSLREIGEFIQLLKQYEIKNLIDVRSFPTSKLPQFCQRELIATLMKNNIKYIYSGKELGGYRKGGYKKHMETEDFKHGLEKLEKIASKETTAFMCAERFPWRCHRRFISLELEERGWQVVHIIDFDRIWQPKSKANQANGLKNNKKLKLF